MSINTTTAYKTDIALQYGKLQPVIDWCEKNCISEWGYIDQSYPPDVSPDYTFYFESERDYVAFVMWEK